MICTQLFEWTVAKGKGGSSPPHPVIKYGRKIGPILDTLTPLVLLTLGILGASKVLCLSPVVTTACLIAGGCLALSSFLLVAREPFGKLMLNVFNYSEYVTHPNFANLSDLNGTPR